MACKACGCTNIEHDASKGMSYCTECGEVCEENTIVSEITFGESSNGAAIVQGSFVRAGQTRANMSGPGRHGSGQESREITLYNSRRRIMRLATALNLSEHFVDSAQRYFTLALNLNFTRGRKSGNVAASCLYIVCRMEKTSQMLIDFSDILQVSVFKLGSTFLRLVQLLNLQLPLVDPSLYISRFASMLEFGDKTQQVCLDAIRLVQRMDRDWIRTGRRPAGICGACLLISARMHNFRRSQREIVRVVKIADTTLRKRLDEFRNTPSGQLTVSDFRSLWLEQSSDPPAFTKSRIKARQAQLAQQQKQINENPLAALRASAEANETLCNDENEMEEALNSAFTHEMNLYLNDQKLKFINYKISNDDFSPDVSTWSDIDDDEVRNVMLTEDEIQQKTAIWDRENKEFMDELERKRAARDMDKGLKKKRRNNKKRVVAPGATALESAQNLLDVKKLSKKINYNVLKTLLDAPKPKIEPVHTNMIPSAAPSRMISVAPTPTPGSGYATPAIFESGAFPNDTGELVSATSKNDSGSIDDFADIEETVVIETGEETASDPKTGEANEDEEEEDDEDEEFDDAVEDTYDKYGDEYSAFNDDDDDGEY